MQYDCLQQNCKKKKRFLDGVTNNWCEINLKRDRGQVQKRRK